jgi:hypothetical protein
MKKKIKITWLDILKYGPDTKSLIPTVMVTEGYLEKEDDEKVIISQSTTFNSRTNKNHPEKTPSFYFIPRGLIQEIVGI